MQTHNTYPNHACTSPLSERLLAHQIQSMAVFQLRSDECETIRDRRLELGLTQEQVARKLEMNLREYQRYERGDFKLANSRMKTGLRICAVLELDPYVAVFGIKNLYE